MSTDTKPNVKSLVFDSICVAYLIGVAAFAITQPSEETLLNMSAMFGYSALALAAGLVATVALNFSGVLTLGLSIFEPQHVKVKREPTPWYRTFWGWQLLIAFIVTMAVSMDVTKTNFGELFDPYGFEGAKRIFIALATPDFGVMPRGILAIVETIFMAFLSTTVAIPAAFLLAFFCSKNIMSGNAFAFAVYLFLRTALNVTRSIEPLIWAIIFSVWVGIGPFAGMLALLFHSVASLAKQYSEIIESVDPGPIEGIAATGANRIQTVWFGIVPQIILPYIAFTIYRWDINVRMATVIGLVGGGGIGTLFIQYQGQALWNEVGMLALLIVIVVWSLDTASAYIREALK